MSKQAPSEPSPEQVHQRSTFPLNWHRVLSAHAPRAIRLSLGGASIETLQVALPLVRKAIDDLAWG